MNNWNWAPVQAMQTTLGRDVFIKKFVQEVLQLLDTAPFFTEVLDSIDRGDEPGLARLRILLRSKVGQN